MAQIVSVNLAALAQDLSSAKRAVSRGTRSNPPRMPSALKAIYERIGRSDDFLLGTNPKVGKGLKKKYATDILHFASSATARKVVMNDPAAFGYTAAEAAKIKNVCPSASPGCIATCLVGAGHGGMGGDVAQFKINNVTNARIRRQLLMERDSTAFFTALLIEISKHQEKWAKKGYKYCVRLNGTSDIDWENIPVHVPKELAKFLMEAYGIRVRAGDHKSVMAVFPRIQFYDYTKVESRMLKYLAGNFPKNYYLTWSLAEKPASNRILAVELMQAKAGNVAVPFDTPPSHTRGGEYITKWPLPKTLTIRVGGKDHTFPVFDADDDDLRFLDPKREGLGRVAGLRFKLPMDKTKRKAIGKTDFRLVTKGRQNPIIQLTGNVINPGKGFGKRTAYVGD